MRWYRCEQCGANLDPGEHCECEIERKRKSKICNRFYNNLFEYMKDLEEQQYEQHAIY